MTARAHLPNPDPTLGIDTLPRWRSAPHRRHGFRNLHRPSRDVRSFRAGSAPDLRAWFSGMVVADGSRSLRGPGR